MLYNSLCSIRLSNGSCLITGIARCLLQVLLRVFEYVLLYIDGKRFLTILLFRLYI